MQLHELKKNTTLRIKRELEEVERKALIAD
jgi:hypothetical protein